MGGNELKIIRGGLINEVVQPVAEQQICVGTPGDHRLPGRIIIRIVMFGNMNRLILGKVTQVFLLQGVGIVFRVPHDKELLMMFCINGIDAGLCGGGKDPQARDSLNILAEDGGVPGMGSVKDIVKPAEQNALPVVYRMRIDAEQLFGQGCFRMPNL